MISLKAASLLFLSAVGTLAAPGKRWHHGQCMSAADAQQVADNYAELIRDYSNKLANEALAVDFVDYSESVNTLINTCPQGAAAVTLPLLSATFSSRQQFETGQGQQPKINFKQLNLEYNCKSITIRWETTNTAPIPTPRPVVGIILLEVEQAPAGNKFPWIVKTVYSEFDSGAWLQNLEQAGICSTTNPSSPPVSLPSGTVGTAPPPASSAGAASGSPSTYVAAPSISTVVVPSGTAAPASYSVTPSVDTCTDSVTSAAAAATYSA
jgi:hypothetical protein